MSGYERIEPIVQPEPQTPTRGSILTFVPSSPIVEWNVIDTRAGNERGFHLHEHFDEYVSIISGHGVYTVCPDGPGTVAVRTKAAWGDTFLFRAGTPHALHAVSDLRMVAMLTRRWDDVYNPATRVELP